MLLWLAIMPITPDPPKSEPRYESRTVEGWPVSIRADFLATKPELAEEVLELLRNQLFQISRMVPAPALAKLRTIRIWVEEAEPHHPCMAYHPNAAWLREHEMSEEKAGCVEIANARNFLDWTKDQPWMVLHELAHGYHHKFLPDGFENADVKKAFERAKKAKSYDKVLKIDGRREKAYALTNPMEYFAEASEAYFGTNDFHPFVRSELKASDSGGFDLMKKAWGKP